MIPLLPGPSVGGDFAASLDCAVMSRVVVWELGQQWPGSKITALQFLQSQHIQYPTY